MKFAKLYKDNREAVEHSLRAMWCSETGNDSQRVYGQQIRDIIHSHLFAPAEAIPLVQCMNSYEPVHTIDTDIAKALVGDLWKKAYSPYEHQYQCWNTLLNEKAPNGKPMSICVTTGTGSGKTECFMMPLVKDLLQQQAGQEHLPGIKAIFLYPLNALMEDQKERLEELLEGTNLTYTVYNGDLPDEEPNPKDHTEDAERLRSRIRKLRGWDEKTKEYKYKHFVYTRELVRDNPPDILLTNPTMLEYILLRDKDADLTDKHPNTLQWMVIDETHTYSGAGAAELAMLLRRVLLAFGKDAQDIKFATSSATFGNGADPAKEECQLREFISGVTGTSFDQVRVIGGKRIGESAIQNAQCSISEDDRQRWLRIVHDDFVKLSDLFPETTSIEDKLEQFDAMCARVPVVEGIPLVKAKIHYFYRVPNNGMFVKLSDHEDGAFKIHPLNTALGGNQDGEEPMLELSRCKHCGEYLAVCRLQTGPGEKHGMYEPLEREDSDMFDIIDNDDEDNDLKYAIIALANTDNGRGDNNIKLKLTAGRLLPDPSPAEPGKWHLVANTLCCCPHCNSKLSHKQSADMEQGSEMTDDMNDAYLLKFRVSPEFISRVMADSILDNLEKHDQADPAKVIMHDGQQFISFADSRQLAARATMKQNLEQEKMWVYSTVFHELCRRRGETESKQQRILELSQSIAQHASDINKMMEITAEISRLQASMRNYMTWEEVAELLRNDRYVTTFCEQFIRRTVDSDETENGNIPERTYQKYVHSIMVSLLSTRPASAAAPETLGLFTTCYPQLEKIALPAEVSAFNQIFENEINLISETDWRNFLQIYIDHRVRARQSVFLKLPGNDLLDIFACERFADEKPRRRPAEKPVLEPGKFSQSILSLYLCALIVRDKPALTLQAAYKLYFDEISAVVDAMWNQITTPGNHLLEWSERLKDGHWDKDEGDSPWRINLKNICFKLFDEVWLCDTNTDSSQYHTKRLRPIENNFKMFSPFMISNRPATLSSELHEEFTPYPYYRSSGQDITLDQLHQWAKTNRRLLWDYDIWGKEGFASNRLDAIYLYPNLFIEAEHTAQVDKEVSRGLQSEFKAHTINILACSTTMEMGVDLGDLEVVTLNSVPPTPANYKQRAGRSGRNNKVTSACITLCNSDAIGLRTLFNPLENIINRAVSVPTVDLMSPQVVQRHVNSYLVRAFGVFAEGDHGGSITQRVIDYYSPFVLRRSGRKIEVFDMANAEIKTPKHMLGDEAGTKYAKFNQKCEEALSDDVIKDLKILLRGTVYHDLVDVVVRNARESNEKRYRELCMRLEDYKFAYSDPDISDRFRTKLMMQYIEVLNELLLNFWATHRFTPNANMPVNVLTLDLNSSYGQQFNTTTSSNPSYGLREALAQYAPGNNIVVDGVAYTVRGVGFSDQYQGARSFKQIYRNDDKCVINISDLPDKKKWDVNNKEAVELVQPVQFLPDINEERSRIMTSNEYTHVSAQLIDTDEWNNHVTEPHLFSVRSNRESGNAKILYYNEGKGFGYCFCTRCGRMVLESEVAPIDNVLDKLPKDFNPRPGKNDRPNFHYAISGKDISKRRKRCGGSTDRSLIKRNVIIGDLLLTDYAEIRLRHKGQKQWWAQIGKNRNLLFTLGIVFTQALLTKLGKERGAVDFTVMPNGHICIFDTNPGGAGYANQLASVPLMKEVVKEAERLLTVAKERKSKDFLLDKYTLRYLPFIDIDAALEWIKEEHDSQAILPDEVQAVSPTSAETTLVEMERAFAASSKQTMLFVNSADGFTGWDYEGEDHGWKKQFRSRFMSRADMTTLCVLTNPDTKIPEPALLMLRSMKEGVVKDVVGGASPFIGTGIYPIAYIDDYLYFVNNVENSSLNDKWGNGTMYMARIDNPGKNATPINLTVDASNAVVFKLSGTEDLHITTKQLGSVIQGKAQSIVAKFIEHCQSVSGPLKVSYQDEHLKNALGIILALQTIEHFVKQMGKHFSLEFLVEKYSSDNTSSSITANIPNSTDRDKKIEEQVKNWAYDMTNDYNIDGSLMPLISRDRNTLTHWRVLSFECGGKRLSIYPDGGFVNEWKLDRQNIHGHYYGYDTDTREDIPIVRIKDIKMDVTIEEV